MSPRIYILFIEVAYKKIALCCFYVTNASLLYLDIDLCVASSEEYNMFKIVKRTRSDRDNVLRWIVNIIITATAYSIIGIASLVLASKYGFAASVFPPAGIALGAVYIIGYPVLPGIFLGSFILNSWIVGNITATGVAQCTIIALGASGQAFLGVFFIRRTVGHCLSFDNDRNILTFICIGIVSSIVSPSVATITLFTTKVLDENDAILNWVNWFIGDAVGTITFAPILLLAFYSRDKLWRARIITIAFPTIIAIGLLGSSYYQVARWDQSRVREDVRSIATQLSQVIHDHLVGHLDVVFSTKAYFRANAQRGVSFREFDEYLRGFQAKFPGIQALEFVPRIRNSDRTSYEAKVRAERYKDFSIRETGIDGKLAPVGDRATYFPVTYVFPLQGNERAVGFDLASNPARLAAMEAAAALDRQVATSKIILVQDKDKGAGFLVFDALYDGDGSHTTGPIGIDNVYGFALGVFKVKSLVDSALSAVAHDNVSINISQSMNDPINDILYTNTPAAQIDKSGMYTSSIGIEVAGRTWVITTVPTKKFISEEWAHQSLWVLFSALPALAFSKSCCLVLQGVLQQSSVWSMSVQRSLTMHRRHCGLY
jgi:CHASE1-domain containing sensor protein